MSEKETVNWKVPNITCDNCAGTINKILSKVQGVDDVNVNVPARTVVISFDPDKTSEEEIHGRLVAGNYPPNVA